MIKSHSKFRAESIILNPFKIFTRDMTWEASAAKNFIFMFLLKYNLFLLFELFNFWTSFIYWSILIVSRESLFLLCALWCHFRWKRRCDPCEGIWAWIDGIIIAIHTSRNAILFNYEPIMGNLRAIFRVFWNINVSFSWKTVFNEKDA